MARALKVFRTSIGFHDAYVAAPSQKAALEAWGSNSNLFGTGLAELVTDPKLTKAPLKDPGHVVKVQRGTAREHLAAFPKRAKKASTANEKAATNEPRPRRSALDRAEKALSAAEAARDKDIGLIDTEIKALQAKRRVAAERHRRRIDRLEDKRVEEAERFEAAMQS